MNHPSMIWPANLVQLDDRAVKVNAAGAKDKVAAQELSEDNLNEDQAAARPERMKIQTVILVVLKSTTKILKMLVSAIQKALREN